MQCLTTICLWFGRKHAIKMTVEFVLIFLGVTQFSLIRVTWKLICWLPYNWTKPLSNVLNEKQHTGQKRQKSEILEHNKPEKGSATETTLVELSQKLDSLKSREQRVYIWSYLTFAELTKKAYLLGCIHVCKFFGRWSLYYKFCTWYRTVLDEWHQNIIMLFENHIGVFWLKTYHSLCGLLVLDL